MANRVCPASLSVAKASATASTLTALIGMPGPIGKAQSLWERNSGLRTSTQASDSPSQREQIVPVTAYIHQGTLGSSSTMPLARSEQVVGQGRH